MTCHDPDLGSASDWLNQISHAERQVRTTTQIWVVTHHQYGISALISQTSFGEETSGSIAKMLAVFSGYKGQGPGISRSYLHRKQKEIEPDQLCVAQFPAQLLHMSAS